MIITYTVIVDDNGTTKWYLNDKLHRENGPAVEYADGHKEWWLNDQLHRENGPAVEYADGHKEWWLNDQLHRVDGPAIEYTSGTKYWYLNGKLLTEEEFNERVKTLDGKVVKIDGRKYQMKEVE